MRTNFAACFLFLLLIQAQGRLIIRDHQDSFPSDDVDDIDFTGRFLESSLNKEVGEAVTTTTIHGSAFLGYYFTTLYLGTPSQKQTVIVDTGSTITTVPCTECGSECGKHHFNEPFNSRKSTTYRELGCQQMLGKFVCSDCDNQCSFNIGYSEGSSYYGRYKTDFVSLSEFSSDEDNTQGTSPFLPIAPKQSLKTVRGLDQSRPKNFRPISDDDTSNKNTTPKKKNLSFFMPFGCTEKETNLFLTQEADGILGLGVGTNTISTPPNIIDSYHLENSSVANAFSLCLAPEGGYLAVGGYNKTFHAKEDVKFVPFDGRHQQYKIHWANLKFQGKDLQIPPEILNTGKGAYVDSGTTLLYTSSAIAKVVHQAFLSFCEQDPKNCGGGSRENFCWIYDPAKYSSKEAFFSTFGTFTFGFGKDGAEYEWKPEDYLYHVPGPLQFFCFGLQAVDGPRTVLGGAFMKNHDILFDKENRRLGFIRANCSGDYAIATYPKSRLPNSRSPVGKIVALIFLVAFAAVLIRLSVKSCRKKGFAKQIQDLELPVPQLRRKDSSSSGSVESSDFRLLSDVSSGDTSLQELEEQFAV